MSNEQAIAESTTKVYLSNIGVIVRSMGFKDVPNAITTGEWLQNSQQIIEHLNRIKNLNTRKNTLMTIIVCQGVRLACRRGGCLQQRSRQAERATAGISF